MQVQTTQTLSYSESAELEVEHLDPKLCRTASTKASEPDCDPTVRVHDFEESVDELTYLVAKTSFEEKENSSAFTSWALGSGKPRHQTDRFIPVRKNSNLSEVRFNAHECKQNNVQSLKGKEAKETKISLDQIYKNVVLNNSQKLFSFNNTLQKPLFEQPRQQELVQSYDAMVKKSSSNSAYRKISRIPFKVLDAPNLQDDFYLNLIDWSKQNVLSVALGSCIYLWDATHNKVSKFCDLAPHSSVCSLAWNPKGTHLSVGTSAGDIQIWDTVRCKKLTQLPGHTSRVSSVAWSTSLLASGSRDKTILYRDIREDPNQVVNRITSHTQEVCGLKWSPDEQSLASGGNDNKLYVWNNRSSIPVSRFNSHCAAVKAIAWNPNLHGLLASGGGSADRTIRFWNTLTNTEVDCIDTGSQVCNLLFSTTTNQFVSTHGYSQNQIIVWKYPTLQKVSTLTGHTSRVLYLAMNPAGENIVTGAGDETLRFWNVFPSTSKPKKEDAFSDFTMRDLR